MWKEAFKVAEIGFSVVFIALVILSASVRLMRYFFEQKEEKPEEEKR